MNIISIIGLGLFLGLKHATDADHVIAVSTIVSKQKNIFHATLVGIAWGVGHTIMLIAIGMMIILFHVSIPSSLQNIFELFVAMLLIVLGILTLSGILPTLIRKLSKKPLSHKHIHLHGQPHMHTHMHSFLNSHGAFHLLRPFFVGIVHGLAGSGAVTLLLLSSISDQRLAIMYLAIFGIGTIVGMMSITTLIAIPFVFSQSKFYKLDRVFTWIAGIVSILYGVYYGLRLISGPSPSFPIGI